MFESINIHSSVAVYVQIENVVLFAVASGQLKPGDKLPSFQELAKQLGVNFNTVAKAYRDLEVMGILFTRRGMGAYINKGAEAQCRQDCRESVIKRLHEVIAEAKASGMAPAEIKSFVNASYAASGAPYADPPDSLLALAKGKAKKS